MKIIRIILILLGFQMGNVYGSSPEFYGIYANNNNKLIEMAESDKNRPPYDFGQNVQFLVFQKRAEMYANGLTIERAIFVRTVNNPGMDGKQPPKNVNTWKPRRDGVVSTRTKPVAGQPEQIYVVPRSPLPAGMYIVSVKGGGGELGKFYVDKNQVTQNLERGKDCIDIVVGSGWASYEYDLNGGGKVMPCSNSSPTTSGGNATPSKAKVFYFVSGHGEKRIDSKEENGYSNVKETIERENHQVRDLLLISAEKVPDDAAVLVVSGPETDYLPAELDKITAFVKKGGRAIFMVDPSGGLKNLVSYLGGFGFELADDVIFDKTSEASGGNIAIPVVVQYDKNHPVTREFKQFTFFPFARSVHIKEDPAKGSFDIAKTSDKSWTVTGDIKKLTKEDEEFNADKHKRGPISVVAVTAVEVNLGDNKAGKGQNVLETIGKILVVGDSDFASNKFMKAGNKDFLLNMLNW